MSEYSVKVNIIEANDTIPCACCGKFHRKLKRVDNRWLGSSCEKQYRIYLINSDITSNYWKGWEKQFNKVKEMVK